MLICINKINDLAYLDEKQIVYYDAFNELSYYVGGSNVASEAS